MFYEREKRSAGGARIEKTLLRAEIKWKGGLRKKRRSVAKRRFRAFTRGHR
jgi:hypothetical protein